MIFVHQCQNSISVRILSQERVLTKLCTETNVLNALHNL